MKLQLLPALLLFSACATIGPTPPPPTLQHDAGLVIDNLEGDFVFAVARDDLRPGTLVTVIVLDEPQRVFEAKVKEKLATNPKVRIEGEETEMRSYVLELSNWPGSSQGIGLVGRRTGYVQLEGKIQLDVDGDGEPEFFRQCTGTTGVHLGIRSEKPLVGPLRWHAFIPLPQEVEPTCKAEELG